MTVVVIVGALIYLIEGEESGFTSIPQGMYWAIVTMTTVGYGDVAPQTVVGKFLASIIMVLGYGIIAVPTGIVSVEMSAARSFEHDHAGVSDAVPAKATSPAPSFVRTAGARSSGIARLRSRSASASVERLHSGARAEPMPQASDDEVVAWNDEHPLAAGAVHIERVFGNAPLPRAVQPEEAAIDGLAPSRRRGCDEIHETPRGEFSLPSQTPSCR